MTDIDTRVEKGVDKIVAQIDEVKRLAIDFAESVGMVTIELCGCQRAAELAEREGDVRAARVKLWKAIEDLACIR